MNPAGQPGLAWRLAVGLLLLMGLANLWAVRDQTAALQRLDAQVQEQAQAQAQRRWAVTQQERPQAAAANPAVSLQCSLAPSELTLILNAVAARQTPLETQPEPPATAQATEPPMDPAARAASLEEATSLVEASLASGVLRRDDVFDLRRLHTRVGPSEEYRQLLSRLVLAINAQQLVPEDPDHPLP